MTCRLGSVSDSNQHIIPVSVDRNADQLEAIRFENCSFADAADRKRRDLIYSQHPLGHPKVYLFIDLPTPAQPTQTATHNIGCYRDRKGKDVLERLSDIITGQLPLEKMMFHQRLFLIEDYLTGSNDTRA
ncbi:hypothetical protein AVEN_213421-1 [Araneus ventricosus]|uniref:Uncharacterized protein n=1 Tax=Araneus ventricosus TaxID=182803 RepID=A0A4Y2RRC3_ARAVE|nr:hypothetical protein AVEN_213421-1 [Araneus ventricosus]